jgi:hypothetical protein
LKKPIPSANAPHGRFDRSWNLNQFTDLFA